jgi:hypothetical protein
MIDHARSQTAGDRPRSNHRESRRADHATPGARRARGHAVDPHLLDARRSPVSPRGQFRGRGALRARHRDVRPASLDARRSRGLAARTVPGPRRSSPPSWILAVRESRRSDSSGPRRPVRRGEARRGDVRTRLRGPHRSRVSPHGRFRATALGPAFLDAGVGGVSPRGRFRAGTTVGPAFLDARRSHVLPRSDPPSWMPAVGRSSRADGSGPRRSIPPHWMPPFAGLAARTVAGQGAAGRVSPGSPAAPAGLPHPRPTTTRNPPGASHDTSGRPSPRNAAPTRSARESCESTAGAPSNEARTSPPRVLHASSEAPSERTATAPGKPPAAISW